MANEETKKEEHENIRKALQLALVSKGRQATKALSGLVLSSQEVDEGVIDPKYLASNKLLKPPYEPMKLYSIVEASSILPQCIDAMVQNTDGFGYDLYFCGEDDQLESDQVQQEKIVLKQFLDKVNEKQSFMTVRALVRDNIESTGNGYMEVIRFEDNEVAMLYFLDARRMRLQAIQDTEVEIEVDLPRNGEVSKIKIRKQFRRFAHILSAAKATPKIKWYKQFGDPRRMDADTGVYEDDLDKEGKKVTVVNEATEVLHFKIGSDVYGVPRWIGNVLNALGLHSADYVNWDLFENQVVPPVFIMVSGGVLTSESVQDIMSVLVEKRGVKNFHKVVILEAQGEGGVMDKNQVKVEVQEMSSARKEDAMFVQYIEKGEKRVRGSFRLPPLYLGQAEVYSKSTADSSKMVAEEQVFVPIRTFFDEVINNELLADMGFQYWKLHSKGPRLVTGEDMISGFEAFGKLGIFTINEGIKVANSLLGLDLTVYKDAWADYPIPIVLKLAELGLLSGIDEVMVATSALQGLDPSQTNDPIVAAKMFAAMAQLREKLYEIARAREKSSNEDVTEAGRKLLEDADTQ